MIDLHCHTNYSDGSDEPLTLLNRAAQLGVQALAITDHDTLEGYDAAWPHARETGFDLLCGVELSTRCAASARSAHLLAYFSSDPGSVFRTWLKTLRDKRLERNAALLRRLHELKINISCEELQAVGKRQIGRPHFAKLMVEKGYVKTPGEAFDRYLCESGLAWVDREEPSLEEAIERVWSAGGIASLAHPVRISRDYGILRKLTAALLPHGLEAIECFHPEHTTPDTHACLEIAADYGLETTGGSDFHGSYKPDIQLATGKDGNIQITLPVLQNLRRRFMKKRQHDSPVAADHAERTCEVWS